MWAARGALTVIEQDICVPFADQIEHCNAVATINTSNSTLFASVQRVKAEIYCIAVGKFAFFGVHFGRYDVGFDSFLGAAPD